MMYDELIKRLREYAAARKGEIAELTADAADAIEELLSERDEVNADSWKRAFEVERDEHRWIPVKERLPDCQQGAEVGNIEWVIHGRVYAGCFGRGGIYRDAYFRTWTDGTEGIDAKDANYWRAVSLPEPPKEE